MPPRPILTRPKVVQAKQPAPAVVPKKVEPKSPPVGLPKPVVTPKQADPDLALAQAAVENYELQKRLLEEMKEDWDKNFPEAYLARQDILQQQDIVVEAINKAKPLIAKIKQSIGDFVATRKYSKARYDEKEVTQILSTLENRLEVFGEMLESGIVEAIGLNDAATIAWFAQRPGYAESFKTAFKDREEQTCAVTTPKI